MNKTPEFSLVTVCFNSEKTIETTIKSVLQQKFQDYEYIIVDGASKDSTMDIIMSYEAKFEGRLKYISEPDKGIYDAFNKGVRMSTGKYVWIVNSDDYIEPNALEELYEISSQYTFENAPIISAGMNIIYTDKTTAHFSSAEKAEMCFKKDRICSMHPSTVIPLKVYEKTGLYDDRLYIAGDLDWLHRAYKAKTPFVFINKIISNMVFDGISSRTNYKKNIADRIIFFRGNYQNPFIMVYRLSMWLARFHYQLLRKYMNKTNI